MCEIYGHNTILVPLALMVLLICLVLAIIFRLRAILKPIFWLTSPLLVVGAIWFAFDLDVEIYRYCLDGDSGAPGDGLKLLFTVPAAFALFIFSVLGLWKISRTIPKI